MSKTYFFSNAAMLYLSFYITVSTLTWDYSADGTNWTTLASKPLSSIQALNFNPSNCRVALVAGTVGVGASPTGDAIFDDVVVQ